MQEICVFNIDDLAKSGIYYERYLKNLEQMRLSYDYAACCLYILDLVSEPGRFMKEEFICFELKNHQVLKRKSLNLKRLVNENEISLGDCSEFDNFCRFQSKVKRIFKAIKREKITRKHC